MRLKLCLLFSLPFIASALYAECAPGYCRGYGAQVVQTATVYSGGMLFMAPTGANLGCTLYQGYYIQLSDTHPHYKEIYATYLSAIATNQYFMISVDSSSTCTVASIRTWNN